jgi:hypothetical protein
MFAMNVNTLKVESGNYYSLQPVDTFRRQMMNSRKLTYKTGHNNNKLNLQRGLIFGLIIFIALLAFEVFNFSTTEFALKDLLGDFTFMGVFWSTILAIAFCGIDFAGIARLFTPEQGKDEPKEVWYLFGAWLLAATMNAMLTWWGVSIAILNDATMGSPVIDRPILLRVVPIFVAMMVWLIRVLIIGTFALAGERLFSSDNNTVKAPISNSARIIASPSSMPRDIEPVRAAPATNSGFRPAPKPTSTDQSSRPEPVYTPFNGSLPQSSQSRQQSHDVISASSRSSGGSESHLT